MYISLNAYLFFILGKTVQKRQSGQSHQQCVSRTVLVLPLPSSGPGWGGLGRFLTFQRLRSFPHQPPRRALLLFQTYMLMLYSTLPRSQYDYTLPQVSFSTAGHHKHITLTFNPTVRLTSPRFSDTFVGFCLLTAAVVSLSVKCLTRMLLKAPTSPCPSPCSCFWQHTTTRRYEHRQPHTGLIISRSTQLGVVSPKVAHSFQLIPFWAACLHVEDSGGV